jgi:hypothetical protein
VTKAGALLLTVVLGGATFVAVTKRADAKPKPPEPPPEDQKPEPRNYYRPRHPDMPEELYGRYENCMLGNCALSVVVALADEMAQLGFQDFESDLLDLGLEMAGEPPPPPLPPPPPPADYGPNAAKVARDIIDTRKALGCQIGEEQMRTWQRIIQVQETGIYDAETALEASRLSGILPPPAPCQWPLSTKLEVAVQELAAELAKAVG